MGFSRKVDSEPLAARGSMAESLFLRLLLHDDKAAALAEAVTAVREGRMLNPVVHTIDPASFRQVPGSPFAYWVSERIRHKFTELPQLESQGREVKLGDHPSDDFRYLRLFWEVSVHPEERTWLSYLKGGNYSPYYTDIHLLVDWDTSRQTYRGFYGRPGRRNERPSNYRYFFLPGLTWATRPHRRGAFSHVPRGAIFSHTGAMLFLPAEAHWGTCAILNSDAYIGLLHLLMPRGAEGGQTLKYEIGYVASVPIPNCDWKTNDTLSQFAIKSYDLTRFLDTDNETSHVFYLPALLQVSSGTLAERLVAWQCRVAQTEQQLAEYQHEVNDIAFRLYGIEGDDRRTIEEVGSGQSSVVSGEEEETKTGEDESESPSLDHARRTTDYELLNTDLLSYTIGCIFGRWDVRFATGERQTPELPDSFASLPVCSPGMLTGDDGLPLRQTPPNYPLHVDWDGILVEDQDHPDDIIRRVHEVLEAVWGERAEAIEREVCEILGIKELRDYFRKPGNGGFWMDHVRRYSKSRRKAPIYWLLQSSKRNYALWLYYHRLDKDILFKALVNYVEPKLRLEESRLEQIHTQRASAGTSGREAKQLEKQLDRQEVLLSELRDFHDKLRRAADLHLEPDLNDGVILNIAPLWELVPWNEAKTYWNELLTGKYEWSSISKQLRDKELVK